MWEIRTVENLTTLERIFERLDNRPYFCPVYVLSRKTEVALIDYLSRLPVNSTYGKWVRNYGDINMSFSPEALLQGPMTKHVRIYVLVTDKDLATSHVLKELFSLCQLNIGLDVIVISNEVSELLIQDKQHWRNSRVH